jgi:hypothetical protein
MSNDEQAQYKHSVFRTDLYRLLLPPRLLCAQQLVGPRWPKLWDRGRPLMSSRF